MRGRAHIALLLLLSASTACEGVVRHTQAPDGQRPDIAQTDYQIPDSGDLKQPPPDTGADNNASPCTDQEAHLGGYCYRALGMGQITYSMARGTCEAAGYKPISIHSAEENQLVFDLLYMWTECAWIGMSRNAGEFSWEDGTPVDFENWEPNEPGDDTCACIGGPATGAEFQGLWQDVRCTRQFREIVCKRKP